MGIDIPQHNSPDSYFECLLLKCINRIGRGSTRDVYEIPNCNKVLKISNRPSNFSNWCEIVVYQHNKDNGNLAEIFSWSTSGKFIIMEKLTPIESADEMEGFSYPDYLTDRKRENYGKDSEGNIKALDYALLKFVESTFPSF